VIGERTIEGVSALTLASKGPANLEVAFAPGAGMVGCSLRHRGEELLGQRGGLRDYVRQHSTMGIPLLYPWANRVGRTRFAVAGREVDLEGEGLPLSLDPAGLPIHGLLAAAVGWRVERHRSTDSGGVLEARFDFAADRQLLRAFPFPHEVSFEAALNGALLTIVTTVRASSDAAVPISFGFHPYLRLPGVERRDWRVEIPVAEHLELDGEMLPTGERRPVAVEPAPLGARTFDDGYLAPAGEAPFVLAGGGRRIELRLGAGYRFAQVYAPADDDVVAYEPMTAPTNALLRGGPDLPMVEPGESFTASFSVAVSDRD
jgi:aldose 1-epimerase